MKENGNLLSLFEDVVATPSYPTYSYLLDADGERVRDADMKFIPDWEENLKHRILVRSAADNNPGLQNLHKQWCRSNILYFANVWCWTYDPRRLPDDPRIPFVTYPFQDDLLTWFLWLIRNHEAGLVEKSRDMGFTWCVEILAGYMACFMPGSVNYQMSLKEDDVDNRTEDSLLGKLRYLMRNLPVWMRAGWVEKDQGIDKNMMIKFPETQAVARGQLTMGTSGRSGRGTLVFNDEYAHVEDADKVAKALASLAPSQIYGSSANGMGNAFYRMAHDPASFKKTLHYSIHPMKNPEWAGKERSKTIYTDEIWAQEHEISYEMSTEGRVFPEFMSFPHTEHGWCHIQTDEYYSYDPNYDVWVGMDFGMADPTSLVFAQIKPPPINYVMDSKEILVFFDEEEFGNKTVFEWARLIKEKKYNYREFVGDWRSGNQRDATGQTWVKYLGNQGITVSGHRNTEQAPIMEVKGLLRLPARIAINRKSCPRLIKGFQNWSYPVETGADGMSRVKPRSKPNHDNWSHCMKATCYLIDWIYGQKHGANREKTLWSYPAVKLNIR